jgi:hypothetical protein
MPSIRCGVGEPADDVDHLTTLAAAAESLESASVPFALGIWDLLAFAIPGSLQLALLGYLGVRLGWLDLRQLLDVPSAVLLAGLAIVCYLLGHLSYAPGKLFDRLTSVRLQHRTEHVRRDFVSENPAARESRFLSADVYLLLTAAELRAREVAMEISRLLASSLMMRNCAVPLSLASATATVELFIRADRAAVAVCAVGLLAATVAALERGIRIRSWALSKALEIAFMLPEIEQQLRMQAHGPALAPVGTTAIAGRVQEAEPVNEPLRVPEQSAT